MSMGIIKHHIFSNLITESLKDHIKYYFKQDQKSTSKFPIKIH